MIFLKLKIILFVLLLSFIAILGHANEKKYQLNSPDGALEITIDLDNQVNYSVFYKKQEIISPSSISMVINQNSLGLNARQIKIKKKSENENLYPLNGIKKMLNNQYNQLIFTFESRYSITFRAYNSGVAYRFYTDLKDSVTVFNEEATFNLNGDFSAVLPETDNYTSWELPYVKYRSFKEFSEDKRAIIPSLFTTVHGKTRVVIAESDLNDYPGMYIRRNGEKIIGDWANYPLETEMGSWGDFVSVVKTRTPFLAKTVGTRAYPWRIIMVTDDDKSLPTNQLVYKLATPSKLKDVSWIKAGKATWEWWHDALLPGAAIPSGMTNRNTSLYKYYVDFASNNKLEYLMVDAGWSDNYNLFKPRAGSGLNVEELINYANRKDVGVFLWCVASTLLKDLDKNMDYISSLGAKGLKVDFIDRDDQIAINWFEAIAKAAAERQLMVSFHGCSKPTGLEKTYPNIINYEAVRGAENSKWDYTDNPDYHLMLPFIRALAGTMDYTPGSMRNVSREAFKPKGSGLPSTMGTRCHELAMFVVFNETFTMLSDSPSSYEKYPDVMKFLSAIPTSFDDTKVLTAELGEYIMMAKQSGDDWYVGAMTNWTERRLTLDFSFLSDDNTYEADLYVDASDANVNASHYTHEVIKVDKTTRMPVILAKGGGAVVYIRKNKK